MKTLIVLMIAVLSTPVFAANINVQAVQDVAQQHHKYISDQDQYGVEDVWTPSLKGDCEDYALWVKKIIGGKLLYVKTRKGEYHVVLEVNGLIVDNLYSNIYPRQAMPHEHIFNIPDTENGLQSFLKGRPIPASEAR